MKYLLGIWLIALAGLVQAEDEVQDFEQTYLMYDCVEKHWICVGKGTYSACEEKRNSELALKPYYSCAPIGEFPTFKSCFQRQAFLTTHNHATLFCSAKSTRNYL